MSFSKQARAKTPDQIEAKYQRGWKDFFSGAKFNRLSSAHWRRGYLEARNYAGRTARVDPHCRPLDADRTDAHRRPPANR